MEQALRLGGTVEQVAEASGVDPWFVDQIATLVDAARRTAWTPRCWTSPCCGTPSTVGCPTVRSRPCGRNWPARPGAGTARAARHPPGVQDRRHLRRRVRGPHALSLQQLRAGPRRRDPRSPRRPSGPRCSILGSGPNRIGQGIEFDYSCVHAATTLSQAGFETVMVNCNPGDGVHRLRHRRPAVLRTADLRGCAGGLPRRTSLRRRRSRGRRCHRPARWADPAGAGRRGWRRRVCRSWAPSPRPSTWPRTAASSVRCCAGPGCPHPDSAPPPASTRRAGSPPTSATRCWCGRPTCSAAAVWRSSTTRRPCRATSPGPPSCPRSTRCWWTGSWRTPSRSTSTRSATAPRSTSAA